MTLFVSRLPPLSLLCLTGLVLGVFAAGWPMAEAATGEGSFVDSVEVRVVEIQVAVRQRGKHFGGLAAADFRLQVDRRQVAIDHFAEVGSGSERAAEPAATDYLVFIDDYYSISADRNRLLRNLAGQLAALGKADRLALVAFDGRKLVQLCPWSRSLDEIQAAVERAVRRPSFGLRLVAERRRVDALRGSLDGDLRRDFAGIGFRGSRLSPGSGQLEPFGTAPQMRRTVRAAAAALRAYASRDNRQVLMLLAGAWPVCDDRFDDGGCDGGGPLADSSTLRRLFAPLIDDANRLGFTLYPIDAAGIGRSFGGVGGRVGATVARLREDRFEDALVQLAVKTGGRAWIDGGGLRALERTAEDSRSFYSLGFVPNWQADDSSHRLRVEVAGRALQVRSRRGFFDLSRSAAVDLRVEQAQFFERQVAGAGELGVELGPPRAAGRGRQLRSLLVRLPLAMITLTPGTAGWNAKLELRVAVSSAKGPLDDLPITTLEVRRSAAPRQGETWVGEGELRLPQDTRRLWVTVFDPLSGDLFSRLLEIVP